MARGVLLDLGGVVYAGDQPLPGAVDALARLRERGIPHRFLTNMSRHPRATIVERLRRLQIPVTPADIYTAPLAVRDWLRHRQLHPFLLIHPGLQTDFAEFAPHDPDAVVVGDAAEHFTHARLNEAFRLLHAGAPLLAIARNRYFQGDHGLELDAGAYVSALEYAAGVQAQVLGKPATAFFHAACSDMALAPEEVVMIGDDLENDVLGALDAGLEAVLVGTGKCSDADRERAESDPRMRFAPDLAQALAPLLDDPAN